MTVSPLPSTMPTPNELGFVWSRAAYLSVVAVLIVVFYVLLERAWHAPWGRMMRAIRDNEVAAEAMGKDVNRRRLEILVLGNIIIGIGGAALITFSSIFDPGSFQPLNHTFLIWVMVILGGAGNNLGTILGALIIYVVWVMSEPATLFLFQHGADWGSQLFGWQATRRSGDPGLADARLRHRPGDHAGAALCPARPAARKNRPPRLRGRRRTPAALPVS